MRKRALETVHTLAGEDLRVVFIGSDLGPGTLDDMKAAYPDRFFMEGVSEQHIIGMAAGMAMEGFIPYVNTIATFLTRRCFEQVTLDLALQNLPVRLLANGGGLVYAPLGPSHLAIDDLCLMSSVPGMTVLAPADAVEMERALRAVHALSGPVYVRFGKGGDPVITGEAEEFALGKIVEKRGGRDVCLVSTGIMTHRVIEAAEQLESRGIFARVLHVPTIKPLDRVSLRTAGRAASVTITVEEHLADCGLGAAISGVLAEEGVRVRRLGLPDQFPHNYGSQDSQLAALGLDAIGIASSVIEILGRAAA